MSKERRRTNVSREGSVLLYFRFSDDLLKSSLRSSYGRRRCEAGFQRSVLIPGRVQVPFYTISSPTQKEMTCKCRLREFTRVKALSLAQGICSEDIAQRTLAPSNITRGVKSISKDCHWKVFLPSTSRCFSPYPIPVFPATYPSWRSKRQGNHWLRGFELASSYFVRPNGSKHCRGSGLGLRKTEEKWPLGWLQLWRGFKIYVTHQGLKSHVTWLARVTMASW